MEKVYLQDWEREGDRVRLIYRDGTELFVRYEDFNRAFGCIVSTEKKRSGVTSLFRSQSQSYHGKGRCESGALFHLHKFYEEE